MKKILFLTALLCASVAMFADAIPSGELYATYQKHGDRFYKGSGETDPSADFFDWNVNYYIVTCGDSIWLRATTTEDKNLTAGWQTQLRVWNSSGTYETERSEVQTNAGGGTKNCYTSIGRSFTAKKANTLGVHFFLDWEGNCSTMPFTLNRSSINNPIEDETAPSINPEEVTMEEVGNNLVFTFGDVTADDEYFFYVADYDHHVGNVSLTNKVYVNKPTVEDGTTYAFKCYAVDYNGNKSAYKEFTLAMPFDPEIDLAENKLCSAGAVQNDNVPQKAVDGDASSFWTCWGQGDASTTWWQVDLGNVYLLDSIMIHFNDIYAAYNIYTSANGTDWQHIVFNATAASGDTKYHPNLTASGRYMKVTSSDNRFGIKEFKVFATGIAAPDSKTPSLFLGCTATTVNSATLEIIATDKDDAGNPGIITSIIVSDTENGFAEIDVLGDLDGENKVTLSDLKYNTTYHFTVTAYDRAGNSTSDIIEVVLPFNTEVNLALNQTCDAGAVQMPNTADKAVDGNLGTIWTSYGQGDAENAWWSVDLGVAYNIIKINITFNDLLGHEYSIYSSLNGTDWTPVVVSAPAESQDEKTHDNLNFAAQYFKATSNNIGFGIKEFEVYGSGYYVPPTPPTAISNAEAEVKAVKRIENGQLIIIKNGVKYNVAGQQVK